MHTCLHCDTNYEGKFCPECGQKSSTHRITFQAIVHDIPHSVFHIDKGLFYTFWQMLYMPGILIRNYVEGKRVRYFSPFAYVFFLSAVSTFVTHATIDYAHKYGSRHSAMLFPAVAAFFQHYPALMLCALVPFIAFWSWIFNLQSKYNYWENLILNTYLIAQFNVVYMIYNLVRATGWYNSGNVSPVILLFMAYITFAYMQFFKQKEIRRPYLKNTLMFLCIAFTFMTGLVFAGFMTPWWGNLFGS